MQIILASASPRRKELLQQIFDAFEIITSDCDENATLQTPEQYVMDLSMQKALSTAYKIENQNINYEDLYLVIGADTIVFSNGNVLGKPANEKLANQMLNELSGKSHEVYTGVTWLLYNQEHSLLKQDSFTTKTTVYVDALLQSEIDAYISLQEPFDKAGGYGIQGVFSKHISKIEGDYFNVVGLPVHDLYISLKKEGIL